MNARLPFVDTAVASTFEAIHAARSMHYVEALQRLQPQSNPQILPLAGGFAVYGGAASPLKKAVGLGFEPLTAVDLERLEAFYAGFGEPAQIEFCPLADGALRGLLQERGYTVSMFLNMLVRAVPEEPLPVTLPPGAVLARVTAADAGSWIRTTTLGFEEADVPSAAGLAIQAGNFHAAHSASFLVWMEGAPVAGGMMASHASGTEFGGTSTRPSHRRLGLQTALLHARLNHARELGLTWALVTTTPGSTSQRNLERAGFRVVYTNVFLMRRSAG